MELDLDALPPARWSPAPAISSFPPALIDVALVRGPRRCRRPRWRPRWSTGRGSCWSRVRLFDVYTGAQVGRGARSLAYKLTFRAPDRTLTAEEAVAARDAAVAAAAERVGAVLRGA